jgi:hypothetical protein
VAPGVVPMATAVVEVMDHVFAGLTEDNSIYVAGEPGYEADLWHHVTPTEFTSIASNGADWWDVTWYSGDLPGTVHVDGA